MSIITKYLFIISYLNILNTSGIQVKTIIPPNPCRGIFLYKFDSNWLGDFQIGPLDYNVGYAMIQLNFIIDAIIPDKSYVKSIISLETEDSIIAKIKNGRPLNYRVYFPFNNPLPVLTAIMLNGETICSGPSNSTYTYYTQRHNLSWSVFPSGINTPNIQNNGRRKPTSQPIPQPNALRINNANIIPTAQKFQISNTECGIIDNQNYNPWLVGLFELEDQQYKFICSGSLISTRHVITAAHCISSIEIFLKLGSNDATTTTGPDIIARYSIRNYTHSDYDPDSYYADLSIILLNEEVTISQKVRPICLWPKELAEVSVVGKLSQLVGWEINQNGFAKNSNPARTNIIVNPLDECSIFNYKYFSHMSICTSDESQGTNPCSRYSGGALIFSVKDRHTLKGVMTVTNSELHPNFCDPSSKFAIFTDISKYSDWINFTLRLI